MPARRKCYYPGALALFAELDRAFARRTQGPLAQLRAAQRPHPAVLPPLPAEGSSPEGGSPRAAPPLPPAAAALPDSSPRAGIEQDAAAAVAEVAAERREAERPPQSLLAAEPTFSLKPNGVPDEGDTGGTAGAAAGEAAGTAGAAGVLLGAGGQPLLRHSGSGSGSFGRPPRSPRPVPRPRPLALSPQSFRGLPAGEPLLSPTGTSPRSSSGPGEESLAGSMWGASSLATAQRGPFAAAPSGSAELADTLTSRLRPLVTSTNGPAGAGRTGSAAQRGGGGAFEAAQPGASVQPHQEGSNLVFLSARPESYKVGGGDPAEVACLQVVVNLRWLVRALLMWEL